ncbi:MAG: TVP38/TMEM64 family inner membrane protein YdjZ [Firmicutes bacterium ADurb.Bin248]|nr:MAG: TVP38/TMEM64 family inner membrane protein YdjZ [Firmicutes bacterium ADurb.Bin248]HOG00713.1 VTT domain-containing protein [Clostridia bacterium]HPK16419.1 VTT domain-containing protein [Clostridia bacterium]
MDKRNVKYLLLRAGVYALLFALLGALIYFAIQSVLPGFLEVLEQGDEQEIEGYMRSFAGLRGLAMAFLLQFIQVVSIICPGGPIQIAAGVVFGFWRGYAVCEAGYLAANAAVFAAARRLGPGMERLFPVGEGGKSRLNFIGNSKNPAFMVFLGCVTPVLPNGIVPYVAARTKIRPGRFALAVFLGSTPTFMMLCALGNRLLQGDFLIVGIIGAVFVAAVVIVYVKRNALIALAGRLRGRFARGKDGQE